MFYLGVYKDQEKAKACITALQAFYADPILSISDGTKDAEYSRFCIERGVSHIDGARLKLPQFAGLWTERYLEEFLVSPEPFVLKLDPDTKVQHKVDSFPEADIFCTFKYSHSGAKYFSGAALGCSRAAAKRILASRLLRDGEYTKNIYAHHRYLPPLLRKGEELDHSAISLQDEILTDICERLSLDVFEWSDVSLENKSAAFYHEH
jgi:hypothetical protein